MATSPDVQMLRDITPSRELNKVIRLDLDHEAAVKRSMKSFLRLGIITVNCLLSKLLCPLAGTFYSILSA